MKICIYFVSHEVPGWASFSRGGKPEATLLPHGMAVLSSHLKKLGHEVIFTDTRSYGSMSLVDNTCPSLSFDVALIWGQWLNLEAVRNIVATVARHHPNSLRIVGGPAVSGSRWKDFPGANVILHGEPEVGLKQALEVGKPDGSIMIECLESAVSDIDKLPNPDFGIANSEFEKYGNFLPGVNPPLYFFSIGRNCPACYDASQTGFSARCVVCNPKWGDKKSPVRLKSAARVTDEVYRLMGSHGTGGIGLASFHDTHFASPEWLREFVDEWFGLIRRIPIFMSLDPATISKDPGIVHELVKLGLHWACIDMGSAALKTREVLGLNHSLDQFHYAAEVIKRNRVNLAVRYSFGYPGETDFDMDANEVALKRVMPQVHWPYHFRLQPGTWIYDQCVKDKTMNDVQIAELPKFPPPTVPGIDHVRFEKRASSWGSYHTTPVIAQTNFDPKAQVDLTPPPPSILPNQTAPVFVSSHKEVRAPEPVRIDASVQTQIDAILQRKISTKPKVTVIIVSYNRPAYLKEAFRSVEVQTMKNWECVIVENGSADPGVKEFVDKLEVSHQNVKIIKHVNNINNVAVCWNEALDVALGEYVCLLDDDNRKMPQFMEKLSSYLDANQQFDGVYCRSQIIDHMGKIRGTRGTEIKGKFTLEEELGSNFIDSGEMLFRRSLIDKIGPFDERCKACEDWDFISRIVHWGGGFGSINELLTEYRAHQSNRIHTSHELGAQKCTDHLREKHNHAFEWSLKLLSPEDDKLTVSQKQVIRSTVEGLNQIPFVKLDQGGGFNDLDAVLVIAPFMLSQSSIDAICSRVDSSSPRRPQLITLHMEDPQATTGNSRFLRRADWLVANDISAMYWYIKKLTEMGDLEKAKKVLCWNALGVNERVADICREHGGEKDIDVLILGYPYPSRAALAKDFIKSAPTNWKIAAVGDGWENQLKGFRKIEFHPTLDDEQTAHIGVRSRVALLNHRRDGDCGGFPNVKPASIHRGFMEAAFGAAILIDSDRSFGKGLLQMNQYADAADAVSKCFYLLRDKVALKETGEINKQTALAEFSYKIRLTRILNMVRAERWNAVVR